MRFVRKALPLLFLGTVLLTVPGGCFLFKKKNKCGDCPSFRSKPKR